MCADHPSTDSNEHSESDELATTHRVTRRERAHIHRPRHYEIINVPCNSTHTAPTEGEVVGITEVWLLVIPWPGQVVLVRVPDFVQLV